MKKPPMKGKYTESSDKKMDAYLTKGLSKKEKAEFKKKDTAHGNKKKPKTIAEDRKKDNAIIKKVKAKEKAEEKAEKKKEKK